MCTNDPGAAQALPAQGPAGLPRARAHRQEGTIIIIIISSFSIVIIPSSSSSSSSSSTTTTTTTSTSTSTSTSINIIATLYWPAWASVMSVGVANTCEILR